MGKVDTNFATVQTKSPSNRSANSTVPSQQDLDKAKKSSFKSVTPDHSRKNAQNLASTSPANSNSSKTSAPEMLNALKANLLKAKNIAEQQKIATQMKEFTANNEDSISFEQVDIIDQLNEQLKNAPNKKDGSTASAINELLKKYDQLEQLEHNLQMPLPEDQKVHNTEKNLNTKKQLGGGYFSVVETIKNHVLGNVLGPLIVGMVEKSGDKAVLEPLGVKHHLAKSFVGLTGWLTADVALAGHAPLPGISQYKTPDGMNLDNLVNKTGDFLEGGLRSQFKSLIPRINQTVDNGVRKLANIFKKDGATVQTARANLNEDGLSPETQAKVDDYLVNREQYDNKDKAYRKKIILEFAKDKFLFHTGQKMPGWMAKTYDAQLNSTIPGHMSSQSLLANELAKGVEPTLNTLGPLGKAIYNIMFYVVPNAYIFGAVPFASFGAGAFEQQAQKRAEALNINYVEYSPADDHHTEPANNISKLKRDKVTADVH